MIKHFLLISMSKTYRRSCLAFITILLFLYILINLQTYQSLTCIEADPQNKTNYLTKLPKHITLEHLQSISNYNSTNWEELAIRKSNQNKDSNGILQGVRRLSGFFTFLIFSTIFSFSNKIKSC